METEKKYRVLVVDDSEYNVEMIQAQLEAEEYEVATAYDGAMALQRVKEVSPDLILLDVLMPVLNGYEVCRRLKENEETRFTPIILITALGETEDRIKGLEAGADDFLIKPLNSLEMLARIRSLLRVKELIENQRRRDLYVAEFSKLLELEQVKREEEIKRRQVYKDVIFAVTNGKLNLCEKSEMPYATDETTSLSQLRISSPQDVGKARSLVEEIAASVCLPKERQYDLAVCVSEAVTNVIKHAGEGQVEVRQGKDSLQVWVEDRGPGIDFSQLPKSTLMKGFSTKPSLGYGYTIMLELLDRVFLCTSPHGTTLVLEMFLKPAQEELEGLEGLDALESSWDVP